MLLRLKVSTPNFMVYGELGRYTLEIDIKVRKISYWCKLIQGKQSTDESEYIISLNRSRIYNFLNKN
jgi:hypothetical protein